MYSLRSSTRNKANLVNSSAAMVRKTENLSTSKNHISNMDNSKSNQSMNEALYVQLNLDTAKGRGKILEKNVSNIEGVNGVMKNTKSANVSIPVTNCSTAGFGCNSPNDLDTCHAEMNIRNSTSILGSNSKTSENGVVLQQKCK